MPLLRRVKDSSAYICSTGQKSIVLMELLPPELDENFEQFTSSIIKSLVNGNLDVFPLPAHRILNFSVDYTFDSTFEVVKEHLEDREVLVEATTTRSHTRNTAALKLLSGDLERPQKLDQHLNKLPVVPSRPILQNCGFDILTGAFSFPAVLNIIEECVKCWAETKGPLHHTHVRVPSSGVVKDPVEC